MIKRILDIVFSFFGLVCLSPIILYVVYKVKVELGSPVLFKQTRPGKECKSFEMIKFRTMKDEQDAGGQMLSDSERLTPFGVRLRKTSIDELPELWNVLKGDMSLVGPRPLLVQYLPLYNKEQARRHLVKPGITGWAQINGRNAISWVKKFELDCWYVDNQSVWLDLKILLVTMKRVFSKEDISADGHATMPFFEGNKIDGE